MSRSKMIGGLCSAAAALGIAAKPALAEGEHYPVQHTEEEWRKLLSPEAFEVLRHRGTEQAFSSALDDEHRSGSYLCAGCSHHVFDSRTKFDSGSGWPSFYEPVQHAVLTSTDTSFLMVRTEVHCATCGGHLGHVFDDGPKPTGLRYCINGVALEFKPSKT